MDSNNSEINSNINVWYITGCTRGVGYSFVEKVLEDPNNRVVGTSRDIKKIQELSISKNPNFLGIQVSIQDQDSIKESVEKAINQFGTITHVLNCAGYGVVGALEEGSEKEMKDIFEVHYFYPLRVIRAVLPHMREKKNGYIFNVGSIAGMTGHPRYGLYCSAKSAIITATQSLAADVKSFNIKASCLILGHFMTNFQNHIVSEDAFVSNLVDGYDTKNFWLKLLAPYMKILTQGDIKKLADLVVNHYAKQSQLAHNLIIGPKETFVGIDRKIKELQDLVDTQRELNSNVVLVKSDN